MKVTKKWILLVLFGAFMLSSCEKDKKNKVGPAKDDSSYALATIVSGGARSYNYYLQSIENIGKISVKSIDNKKATEMLTGAGAGVFQYKKSIYLNAYHPSALMYKWDINDDGSIKKTGGMSMQELSFVGNPAFKSDEVAFVSGPAQSKILIFNPTTMKKTGFIDFSKFSKIGTTTNFPKKGTMVKMEICSEMVISGKYMYAAINRINDFQKYIPATDGTDILVIDLDKVDPNSTDNSSAVIKEISSDKGAVAGAWNSGFGASFMTTDEKGDVYMLCHNTWGYAARLTKKPSCVLRIKSGSTDFDNSYYLNIEEKTLGVGNPVYNLEYAGNGRVFVAALDVRKVDPNSPYSFFLDPLSQWHMVNLYDQSVAKVSEEYTRGSLNGNVYVENDKAYLPYSNKKENYIIEYDMAKKTTKKLFTTNGTPIIFKVK